jgi:hypothetical protein
MIFVYDVTVQIRVRIGVKIPLKMRVKEGRKGRKEEGGELGA